MVDDKGKRVKEATPSMPVEILGLSDVPSAGEVFIAHENDKTARTYNCIGRACQRDVGFVDGSHSAVDTLHHNLLVGQLQVPWLPSWCRREPCM